MLNDPNINSPANVDAAVIHNFSFKFNFYFFN